MSEASLPIGGTTGCCHESNAAVDEAAAWLASTPVELRPHPLVPALRARFGLTAIEAVTAIREANRRRRAA